MVIDEKQSENTNEMEEEVAPVTDPEIMPVDESSTAMVKQSLNIKSFAFFRIIRNKKQYRMSINHLQNQKKRPMNQLQFQVVVFHEKMFLVLEVVVVQQPTLALLVHVSMVDVVMLLYLLQLLMKEIIQH